LCVRCRKRTNILDKAGGNDDAGAEISRVAN